MITTIVEKGFTKHFNGNDLFYDRNRFRIHIIPYIQCDQMMK